MMMMLMMMMMIRSCSDLFTANTVLKLSYHNKMSSVSPRVQKLQRQQILVTAFVEHEGRRL